MWKPTYTGDLKKLKNNKVKIIHGINCKNIDQFESEGNLIDIFFDDKINEYIILIRIIKTNRKYGSRNIFISKYGLLAIKSSEITSADIQCFEINNLVRKKCINSLCLDISHIILDFANDELSALPELSQFLKTSFPQRSRISIILPETLILKSLEM